MHRTSGCGAGGRSRDISLRRGQASAPVAVALNAPPARPSRPRAPAELALRSRPSAGVLPAADKNRHTHAIPSPPAPYLSEKLRTAAGLSRANGRWTACVPELIAVTHSADTLVTGMKSPG